MAAKKKISKAAFLARMAMGRAKAAKRRGKRGKGWDDFAAGFMAPINAVGDVFQGDLAGAAKRFTDLGPRLAQGFTGNGRRRRRVVRRRRR